MWKGGWLRRVRFRRAALRGPRWLWSFHIAIPVSWYRKSQASNSGQEEDELHLQEQRHKPSLLDHIIFRILYAVEAVVLVAAVGYFFIRYGWQF